MTDHDDTIMVSPIVLNILSLSEHCQELEAAAPAGAETTAIADQLKASFQAVVDDLLRLDAQLSEARAENVMQRVRYQSFLDWCIGFTDVLSDRRDLLLNERLRKERAALEPPADPGRTLDDAAVFWHGRDMLLKHGLLNEEPPAERDKP